ncbi:MAG: hypothetical protein D6719_00640 [Candidatus Dadabacteria bacterium]|nr:MAG: hypothetical protein D6719_00640 [Candidatus Dadabacteria bacterium]
MTFFHPCSKQAGGSMSENTLFNRLGGNLLIASIADTFLVSLRNDASLSRFFAGYDQRRLRKVKQALASFLIEITDGPQKYRGPGLKATLERIGVTSADWRKAFGYLAAALDTVAAPNSEKTELLQRIYDRQPDLPEEEAVYNQAAN